MEISFTPSYEEYLGAGRVGTRTIFTRQIAWLKLCSVVFAIVGLFVFGQIYDRFHDAVGPWTAALFGAAIGFSLYVLAIQFSYKVHRRLIPGWLRRRRPESPVRFSVEPDYLEWNSTSCTCRLGFLDIDQIVHSRTLVGFVSGVSMFYVPLRAFASSAQLDMLVRSVFDRLSDQAKSRSRADAYIRTVVGG